MAMQQISVSESPVPSGSYSQGIISNGLLFVAGMGPFDPVTREIVGETIEEQTVQAMQNLQAVLRGAGRDLGDVVNTTVYLAELTRDWTAFDATYGRFFEMPYPARTVVGAALKGMLIEVSAVAAMGDHRLVGNDGARAT